jgi:hypothetical protein
MALVERSRFAIYRGELARVRLVRLGGRPGERRGGRLVRLGGRQGERRGGRLARMRLQARDCSVPSLGRELIRRARLRGVDMPRRGWRQGRSWRGGHTRPLGKEDRLAAGGLLPAFVQ